MRHDPTDEELLRSYLLGTLPEAEADPLEDRLLREDELFELSEAIEADLLAACDRGELAPEERERVLRRLASSPQGRERFAFASSLNAAADAPARVVVPFPRRQVFQWAALAAILLAAVGLSWYAMENPHGGEAAPWVAQERPAPANPVTSDLPLPPPPPPPIAQESRPPVEAPKPAKVVCQLALMTLRGGSEPAKQLRVPSGTGVVEFQIGLEGMEDLESFHVLLRSPEGETLLNKRGVKPKTLDRVRTLVVELPASRLSAGRYEIETQGIAPGSEPEALSPLSIEVVRSSKR
jgi:hypothetical protein